VNHQLPRIDAAFVGDKPVGASSFEGILAFACRDMHRMG